MFKSGSEETSMPTETSQFVDPAQKSTSADRGGSARNEPPVRKGWNAFDVWQDRVRRAAEGARSAQQASVGPTAQP